MCSEENSAQGHILYQYQERWVHGKFLKEMCPAEFQRSETRKHSRKRKEKSPGREGSYNSGTIVLTCVAEQKGGEGKYRRINKY